MNPLWVLWTVVAAILVVHSALYLQLAFRRARMGRPAKTSRRSAEVPWVTVQVCVRNEGALVAQCLEAVARLDWPRLEVQVLDDSDEVEAVANSRTIALLAAKGLDIHHVRRQPRQGFKAGALQEGLRRARGAWLLPLDADFLLPADFLRRLAIHMDDDVACIQTRWAHRNADANPLTGAQELAMAGHFLVEQAVRADRQTLMSFNSTACLWSKSHAEAVGGWSSATLAEDLDLSIRALAEGSRFVYLEDVAPKALLPERLGAFAGQQARWARGSMQNARLYTRTVLRSPALRGRRLATLHHLWHYSIHPLIFALFTLQGALVLVDRTPGAVVAVAFPLMAAGPLAMYGVAACESGGARGLLLLRHLPVLTAAGLGCTPRLALAATLGIASRRTGVFVTTPKGPTGYRVDWPAAATAAAVAVWALVADLGDPAAPGVLVFGACCAAAAVTP